MPDRASRPENEPPPSDIPLPSPRHAAPSVVPPFGPPVIPVVAALPAPDTALWLLLVLAGAAALCWLMRRHKALRAVLTADPWADPRAVDNTLTLAQDQRTLFRLTGQGGVESPLSALCVHLDRHTLVLRPAHNTAEAALWTGRPVRLEFSISAGDSPRFFRCDSVVLRSGGDGTRPLLELARPARLEPYRRRAFPRVRLMRSELAAAGLWRGDDSALAGDAEGVGGTSAPAGRPPDNPARLGAPLFVFRPGAADSLRLDNLSASGVGVRIPREASPPARCVIFLCLRTDNASPLALWLDCECRHLTTRPGRATALMGLRISHWGRVARAEDTIPWTPAASDGSVPPLLRWTLRRAACLNL